MSVSLAQGNYCDANNLDPEDPRCLVQAAPRDVLVAGRPRMVLCQDEHEQHPRPGLLWWRQDRHPQGLLQRRYPSGRKLGVSDTWVTLNCDKRLSYHYRIVRLHRMKSNDSGCT